MHKTAISVPSREVVGLVSSHNNRLRKKLRCSDDIIAYVKLKQIIDNLTKKNKTSISVLPMDACAGKDDTATSIVIARESHN